MSQQDILSQEEIDALLDGVKSGAVDTASYAGGGDGTPQTVDLTVHERIVRGRMPTLEMISNRFCRNLRVSLFNFLQRAVDISFQGVRLLQFSEHIQKLDVPTSLNIVRVPPLHGNGLFVFDARLVWSLVETYFGGGGKPYANSDVREFTAMEGRVVQLILDRCFADMKDAWSPVMAVDFEYVNSEANPQFANIVSPTELVVVASFSLSFDDAGGELFVTLPYAMLEPIRELLDAGVQSDRHSRDDRWTRAIREDMNEAEIELGAKLLDARLTIRELLNLKPGDIMPVEMPDEVVLCAEGVPLYRGQFGASNGSNAIRIEEPVKNLINTPSWMDQTGDGTGNSSDTAAGRPGPAVNSVE